MRGLPPPQLLLLHVYQVRRRQLLALPYTLTDGGGHGANTGTQLSGRTPTRPGEPGPAPLSRDQGEPAAEAKEGGGAGYGGPPREAEAAGDTR